MYHVHTMNSDYPDWREWLEQSLVQHNSHHCVLVFSQAEMSLGSCVLYPALNKIYAFTFGIAVVKTHAQVHRL